MIACSLANWGVSISSFIVVVYLYDDTVMQKVAMEVENQPRSLAFPPQCEHRLPEAQPKTLLTPVGLSPRL